MSTYKVSVLTEKGKIEIKELEKKQPSGKTDFACQQDIKEVRYDSCTFAVYGKSPGSRIPVFCTDECRTVSCDRMGEEYV